MTTHPNYITRERRDRAAQIIAELAELASFKDVGATAIMVRDLCRTLNINPGTVAANLSTELLGHPDFSI